MKIFTKKIIIEKMKRASYESYLKLCLPLCCFLSMILGSLQVKAQPCAVTGTATSTPSCIGVASGTATITLSGDGSGAPGTYTVDGGSSQPFSTNPFTVTSLSAGSHIIVATVTAGSCVSSNIPVTIASSVLPIPSVSPSATPSIICVGSSSNLTATGASTYTWQPGSLSGASVNVSPTTTTTYTVTGANADGCSIGTAWAKISAGGNHTLAIKTDGTLWAWGMNADGQVGDGSTTDRSFPVQVGTANDWVFISAGSFHSLAIKSNGTLWAWGDNLTGQLGDGSVTDRLTPVQVGVATNWASVAAGGTHSMALKTDGSMWVWGANNYSQVGDGTITQRNSPVQIGAGSSWISISAGQEFSLALKSDNKIFAWGRNVNGQLGDGTTTGRTTPLQIGTSNWSKIAACYSHCLAIKTDGTLWAWGSNLSGQIGDGTTVQKPSPVQVGVATDWVDVDGGLFYSFGYKSNNTLWSWGSNIYGQIGDGTATQRNSPVQSGVATNWTAFAIGLYHCVGLRTGGTIWTWGWHMNGRLGDGTTSNKLTAGQLTTVLPSVAVIVNPLPTVSFSGLASSYCLVAPAVTLTGSPSGGTFGGPGIAGNTFNPATAGAGTHSITYSYTNANGCTNTASQSVTVTFTDILNYVNLQFPGTASVCQGTSLTAYGQIYEPGLTEAAGAGAGVIVEFGYNKFNTNPATWTSWQPATFNVQAGNNDEYASTVLLPAGTYYYTFRYTYVLNGCGYQYGGFSSGGGNPWDGINYVSGVLTVNAPPTVTITSPTYLPICHDSSATLSATGAFSYTWMPGSLSGSSVVVSPPSSTLYTAIGTTAAGCSGTSSWLSFSAGGYHNVGVKTDGSLWGSGSNQYGQTGDLTNTTATLVPVRIGTANNWLMVSGGNFHSLAIKTDGTLWGWGINDNGQIGDGTVVNKSTPVQVGTANNWAYVSAGGTHSLAMKTDGSIWGWGYNGYGQLGDGTFNQRNSPVQIGTGTNWVSISGGGAFTLALRNDGTIWSCGRNTNGQLGDGTVNLRATLLQIGSSNNWRKITAAFSHSLAIKTDGTLWAWGRNMNGQIGDGTTTDKLSPVKIGVATDWETMDGGLDHSVAIKSNGTLWAWGSGAYGQLGDGTLLQKVVPTQAGILTNWLSVDAGVYHNHAVKRDATLWVWGRTMESQLGDGNGVSGYKTTPITIGGQPGIVHVSPYPEVIYSVSTSSSTICNGSSATLTASSFGLDYLWMPGALTGRIVTVSPTETTTYTVVGTESTGCSKTLTITITVNPLPTVSFSGLAASYCTSDGAVTLTGSPAGGIFTGNGVIDNTFNPTLVALGGHNITYTYTDANGCSNSQTKPVLINGPQTVNFIGLAANYCVYNAPVTLTPSPAGGTFSGPGISGNVFSPSVAGPGEHTITYIYNNGCNNYAIKTVNINDVPAVSFTGLSENYCSTDAVVTLTGSPLGGSFSGPGISGNTFNPATAGEGTHSITYTFVNGSGCINAVTHTATVSITPVVSFTGLPSTICSDAAAISLLGSPGGGEFSGPGIIGESFYPSVAGVGGPYTITYTYTTGGGCTSSATHQVSVTSCASFATLNLKMYIQGYYQNMGTASPMDNFGAGGCMYLTGGSANAADVDQVSVSLMNPSNGALVEAASAVLHTDGTLSANFSSSVTGNSYYLKIIHRNSLETWSGSPVAISTVTTYDFTTAASKAYGNNQVEMEPGVWAIYSGDIIDAETSTTGVHDGVIESADYSQMENDVYLVSGGYVAADITGDGVVESADYSIMENNVYLVISVMRPF